MKKTKNYIDPDLAKRKIARYRYWSIKDDNGITIVTAEDEGENISSNPIPAQYPPRDPRTYQMKPLLLFFSLFILHSFSYSQSTSSGSPSNGTLVNGAKVPFKGDNYKYFDKMSYSMNRCYLNDKILLIVQESYEKLKEYYPDRMFYIMECSNKHGGPMKPHSTHQNGTSIDFMSPLIQNGSIYSKLDDKGAGHYLMEFNNDGQYIKDTSISIDFDLIAHHILILQEVGKKHGVNVKKVILKTDLKDEFYRTPHGKKVKSKGIYLVKALPKRVNDVHDDHFHIDFGIQ
jgi:penicillin-insensitive murein endopeptidase